MSLLTKGSPLLIDKFSAINKERPLIMHIDLNSAFATAEQQAHPWLRGRPMGVTNRISPNCCVIAASYEAKALGIKVGMTYSEAKAIAKSHGETFIMLETDPPKYHYIYVNLMEIMKEYCANITMKSIDEGIMDFHGHEAVLGNKSLEDVGYEIKVKLKQRLGSWMRINVGIGTNRFLAKQAASWHKPNGLDTIDYRNLRQYYREHELMDLSGIAERNQAKLNAFGITTPLDFLKASELGLNKQIFHSITGTYWYRRLRGWEIDDYETHTGMVGRQWVLVEPTASKDKVMQYFSALCETTGTKLRYNNLDARGICVWAKLLNGETVYSKRMFRSTFFTTQEIKRRALAFVNEWPFHERIRTIGVSCYQLTASNRNQLSIFDEVNKQEWISTAMDTINEAYGLFTVFYASSTDSRKLIKQKIPFGGTKYFKLLLGTA